MAQGDRGLSDTDNLTPAKSSSAAIVFGAILCGVIGLLWVPMNATLTSLTGSDAAGNGIAQAYAGISIALVWGVLGLLVMIAVFKGRMPIPERVAVLVLVPASGREIPAPAPTDRTAPAAAARSA